MEKHEEKKVKTFNRLPERFQWHEGLDDDHIFEEEKEMINTIRSEFGTDVHNFSDKLILYFLFARRHKIDEARELLRNFINLQKELGFDKRPPRITDYPEIDSGFVLPIKGAVDKHGRMVMYMRVRHNLPTKTSLNNKLGTLVWENIARCEMEPVKTLRNGTIMILDLKGAGLQNRDGSPDGKKFFQMILGTFPRRTRGIYLVNSGAILKIIFSFAKLVMPKKMLKRVHAISKQQLHDLVPSEWILKELGGTCKLSPEDVVQSLKDFDKQRYDVDLD